MSWLLRLVVLGRLFSIGDIHGEYDGLVRILHSTGLAHKGIWTGGNSTVILLGDVVDRGPDVLSCLRLVDHLGVQAQLSGGYFGSIMGNHEWMNLNDDFSYANRAYQLEEKNEIKARIQHWPWMIRTSNDILFVHSEPPVMKNSRAYAIEQEHTLCPRVERLLHQFNASTIVVGHTPIWDKDPRVRCGKRLVLTDLGFTRSIYNYQTIVEWLSPLQFKTQSL